VKERVAFLNWRPDAEDFGNEGLSVCTNAVHDSEGWKPTYIQTAGAFATTGGLQSVTSLVAKPIGPGTDTIAAWISNNTLNIGINGVTATTGTTGYPVSFATAGTNQAITFFDAAEMEGPSTGLSMVFFTAEMQQNESTPSTVSVLRTSGYFTLTSL
jgi:CO/xanthine dehydrogenase Mo-binding subunit